jgi:hypothetical protein
MGESISADKILRDETILGACIVDGSYNIEIKKLRGF